MGVKDIFNKVSDTILKGMMIHEQLMNAYLFMELEGYAKCHEHHYSHETKNHIKVSKYLLDNYGYLIEQGRIEPPELIHPKWYGAHKSELDPKNRIRSVKDLTYSWITWEVEAFDSFNRAYKDLFNEGEFAAAEFIKEFSVETAEELSWARSEALKLEAVNYDPVYIMEEQPRLKKKFKG